MNQRRHLIGGLAGIAALLGSPRLRAAESFPTRPLRLVVPFPPGGITDVVARLVAPVAAARLGQPIVVENRAGAGGVLGTSQVAQSEPDGYTFMLGTISVLAIRPALGSVPYDAAGGFDHLTLATRAANLLVVHPDLPVRTVKELVDQMKQNPGRITFANSGSGSSDHLMTELFWQKTGTSGVHVPFLGSGPAATNLLGGHVQASFRGIPDVIAHVKAGKLRLIAQATDVRLPEFPDTPTLSEAGVVGADVYSWQGFVAPRGLDRAVRQTLGDALGAALRDERVREALKARGIEAVPSAGEAFAAFQRAEIALWSQVVKAGNISVNQ